MARFWSKVDLRGPDECWLWIGLRDEAGYGRWGYGKRQHRAHRWLLGELRGAPLISDPRGVEDACHRCDNPPCVNPAHLYVGTRKRNIADAVERKRLWQLKKDECPKGHPYDKVRSSRDQRAGRRRCSKCELEADTRTARRTHCKYGHPLSGENLLLCKNCWRKCRICDSARLDKIHGRQRAA